MTRLATLIVIALSLTVPACGSPPQEEPARDKAKPPARNDANKKDDKDKQVNAKAADADEDKLARATEAAEIANKIQEDPAKFERILEAAGMTPDEFHGLLFELAEDPELAAAYADARTPMPDEIAEAGKKEGDQAG